MHRWLQTDPLVRTDGLVFIPYRLQVGFEVGETADHCTHKQQTPLLSTGEALMIFRTTPSEQAI
jgi:hypothetical protein